MRRVQHTKLTPKPVKSENAWFVQIDRPEGGFERVGVFRSRLDAKQWIVANSRKWMATRGQWMTVGGRNPVIVATQTQKSATKPKVPERNWKAPIRPHRLNCSLVRARLFIGRLWI